MGDSTSTGTAVPARRTLPSRHIHLDFHTSPAIPDVGRDFDPDEFAGTLSKASVKSITIFAKCHHGMAYYPTKVGVQHPGLSRDLLAEQIAACHRQGIQVAAYISVMYDQRIWNSQGGWRCLARDGSPVGLRSTAGPLDGELGKICLNTPYLDYVAAMATEVAQTYEVDGLFFDNVQYGSHIGDGAICFCQHCVDDRRALGVSPDDRPAALAHMQDMIDRSLGRLFASVSTVRPDASIFVNGQLVMGAPAPYLRRIAPRYEHLEIESLPGGDWGYTHFPMAVRMMRNFGVDIIGMTGAFHRSWGDFGSVRTQEATDFECQMMLAQGAKVAVGDHMHPRGVLNATAYERIGRTFRDAEAKEEWCAGATPVAEIGLLVTPDTVYSKSVQGASKILTQLKHQFDLIDEEADFERYRLLILPDDHRVLPELAHRLTGFVANGGKLIATGQSLPTTDHYESLFGLKDVTPWAHQHQYLQATSDLPGPPEVHVVYESGPVPVPAADSVVLAHYWAPYFDNTYTHFQVEQVPPSAPTSAAAIVATDRSVYIAPPLFRDYATHAYPPHRALIAECIRRLLPTPAVQVDAPSTMQVTVTAQPGRTIIHLLHYVPEMRSPGVEIVEDVYTLRQVPVRVRSANRPTAVYTVPDQVKLPSTYEDGYVQVEVPEVTGHQMLVVEHEGGRAQ